MKILMIWQMKVNSAMEAEQSGSEDAHWFILAVRTLQLRPGLSMPGVQTQSRMGGMGTGRKTWQEAAKPGGAGARGGGDTQPRLLHLSSFCIC